MNKKNKIPKKTTKNKPIVVAVSGGFDPIHIGHIRMIQEAKKLGDKLIVIVNGDSWLIRKKGFAFMKELERVEIVKALKDVDEVYIHRNSKDYHVNGALKKIHPHIFANGGDRKNIDDIPEAKVCRELGIEMIFNVGHGGKVQSSSWLTAKIPTKAKKIK